MNTLENNTELVNDNIETDYPNEILALAQFLGTDAVNIEFDWNNQYSCDGMEFIVCDNDTAESLFEESLDNYIEELILPEIPQAYRQYFDEEKWKRDAAYDGRGHSLSSYDGAENKETVNGETYYIYRTN